MLPDRELSILEYRWPTNPRERMTLEGVAYTVGLSKERVRQLEYRAIRKLLDGLAGRRSQLASILQKQAQDLKQELEKPRAC